MVLVTAEPQSLEIDLGQTAVVIIDMQRDFLEPGGFGAALGNDITQLASCVEPCRKLLAAARAAGLLIVHTREGHLPDLSDAPPAKVERGSPELRIGAPGPMGRILIRGEAGHDIIPDLYPLAGEIVIDKPGKGAFYSTPLGEPPQREGDRATSWSPVSRRKSASTPPSARPTTAATAASPSATAAAPIFRNFIRWASR